MEDKDKQHYNIHELFGRIDTKLNQILKENSKMMFAMLAIIASSIGLKFIGSPVHTILFSYASLFGGTFLSLSTIVYWKKLKPRIRVFRVSFAVLVLFSTAVRSFIYKPGIEPSPEWFSPAIDLLYVWIIAWVVFTTWKRWHG